MNFINFNKGGGNLAYIQWPCLIYKATQYVLAKGRVWGGAWEEPNQLGSGYIRSRPLPVAKAWFQKVPNIREFLGGNSWTGKKAVLLFVGEKNKLYHFRSQQSSSDETGFQNVILVKPLPSWN